MKDLKPVKEIAPPAWMQEPGTRAVMTALNEEGGEPRSLFVGGCIRNEILGRHVDDIDIAAASEPAEVTHRLENAGIKVIPTGIDHGTVTAVTGTRHFEITTLRRDVKTDGRHAQVEYTDDWIADARRRDFRLNTLLGDIEGRIYDPLGCGLEDCLAGRVVFVGDPSARIQEDYLRILRFFRFYATYGQAAPDAEGLEACRAHIEGLYNLSRERITQEAMRILALDNPVHTLRVMFENNILIPVLNPDFEPDAFEAFCADQLRYDKVSAVARLFFLCGAQATHLQKAGDILILTRQLQKDAQAYDKILKMPFTKDLDAKKAIYHFGGTRAAQGILMQKALGRIDADFAAKALNLADTWQVPECPISGDDLIAQGYQPGPTLGKELRRQEQAWIQSGFPLEGHKDLPEPHRTEDGNGQGHSS